MEGLRLGLVKIGALVKESGRRVHVALASACPTQEIWVRLSRRGKYVLVERSRHEIHLDRPDAFVAAVHEVVEAVRRPRGGSFTYPAPFLRSAQRGSRNGYIPDERRDSVDFRTGRTMPSR